MNPPPDTNGHDHGPAEPDNGVRTYRGKRLADLLPRIREELGPDAVILREREGLVGGINGFFAQRFIEVEARAGEPSEITASRGSGRSGRVGTLVDVHDDDEEMWDEPLAELPSVADAGGGSGAGASSGAGGGSAAGSASGAGGRARSAGGGSNGRAKGRRGGSAGGGRGRNATPTPTPWPDPENLGAAPGEELRRSMLDAAAAADPEAFGRFLDAAAATQDAAEAPRGAAETAAPDLEPARRRELAAAAAAESEARAKAQADARARAERERAEAERLEAERLEAERVEAERAEAARAEAERLEVARIEAEQAEAERLAVAAAAKRDAATEKRRAAAARRRAKPAPEPEAEDELAAATLPPALPGLVPAPAADVPEAAEAPSAAKPARGRGKAATTAERTRAAEAAADPASVAEPAAAAVAEPAAAAPELVSAAEDVPEPARAADEAPAEAAPPTRNAASDVDPPAHDTESAAAAAVAAAAQEAERTNPPPAPLPLPEPAKGVRRRRFKIRRRTPGQPLDANAAVEIAADLVGQGLHESWVQRLIVQAASHYAPFVRGDLREATRFALAGALPSATVLPPGGARLAFIGPGGSGKTRLTAAFAAAYATGSTMPVCAVSLAGKDQGRLLTALLAEAEVPVAQFAGRKRAVKPVRTFSEDGVVVIDTPSLNAVSEQTTAEIGRDLLALDLDMIYLALPAGLGEASARRLIAMAAPMRPSAVAITHADESAGIGEVVQAACEAGLPVAYVGEGYELGVSMSAMTPHTLAARLLP